MLNERRQGAHRIRSKVKNTKYRIDSECDAALAGAGNNKASGRGSRFGTQRREGDHRYRRTTYDRYAGNPGWESGEGIDCQRPHRFYNMLDRNGAGPASNP